MKCSVVFCCVLLCSVVFCCDVPAQIVAGGRGGSFPSGADSLGPDTVNISVDNFYFDLDWQIQQGPFGRPYRDMPDGRYAINAMSFDWAGAPLSALNDTVDLRFELFDRDGSKVESVLGTFERTDFQKYELAMNIQDTYPRSPGGAVAATPLTLRLSTIGGRTVVVGQTKLGGGQIRTDFQVSASAQDLKVIDLQVNWKNGFSLPAEIPDEIVHAAMVGPGNINDPTNSVGNGFKKFDPEIVWTSADVGINNADSSFGVYTNDRVPVRMPRTYFYQVGNRAQAAKAFNFGTWVRVLHPQFDFGKSFDPINDFVQGNIRVGD